MHPANEGVFLVTGGNSGIGLECTRTLARRGCRVVIASRDRGASDEAAGRINDEVGRDVVEALSLDLASFESIRGFSKEIEARQLPLRALVCNAGLQMGKGPVLSADGHELTFAVNHLGHFLLTNLLLRRLLASGPARIVVVASGVHDPDLFTGMPKAAVESWEALSETGGSDAAEYDGRLAYVNSKLCNLWFTYELARRLAARGLGQTDPPLSVNAFEPGLVPGSGLARDYAPVARWIWDKVLPVLALGVSRVVTSINTADHSGTALANVVLDPELERRSGLYFPSHSRFAAARSSRDSYDEARQRGLWEASTRYTRLSSDESPLVD